MKKKVITNQKRKVHDKINLAVQSEAFVVHIREMGLKRPDQEGETEFPGTTILLRNHKAGGSLVLSFIAQLPVKSKVGTLFDSTTLLKGLD